VKFLCVVVLEGYDFQIRGVLFGSFFFFFLHVSVFLQFALAGLHERCACFVLIIEVGIVGIIVGINVIIIIIVLIGFVDASAIVVTIRIGRCVAIIGPRTAHNGFTNPTNPIILFTFCIGIQ
jgi:hypothetical protein